MSYLPGVSEAVLSVPTDINTLRPRQNGRHFADDTFNRNVLNENVRISIDFSLKFVPKGPINNIPALVQIMAWRRPDDKPLSEPVVVSLLTHICVTRPQWVYNPIDLVVMDSNKLLGGATSLLGCAGVYYAFYKQIIYWELLETGTSCNNRLGTKNWNSMVPERRDTSFKSTNFELMIRVLIMKFKWMSQILVCEKSTLRLGVAMQQAITRPVLTKITPWRH